MVDLHGHRVLWLSGAGVIGPGTFGQRFTSSSHWSSAYHDNSSFRGSSADGKFMKEQIMSNWSSVLRAFLLGIFAIGSRPEIIKSALPVLSYTYTNAIMRYMSNMSKNYFSNPFRTSSRCKDCSCPNYLLYKVVDLPLHRLRYTRNGISKIVWTRRDSDSWPIP